jgi:hypothetical protein
MFAKIAIKNHLIAAKTLVALSGPRGFLFFELPGKD